MIDPADARAQFLAALAKPASDERQFEHYYDPITGHNVVRPYDRGLFEKPEGHVGPALTVSRDQLATTISDMQDRRKLPVRLAEMGGKPPPRLAEAFEVLDAIRNATTPPVHPNVMTLKPADVPAAVVAYGDQLARLEASKDAIDRMKDDAYHRIVKACQDSVSDVVKDRAIRAEFDAAAKEFSESYPIVRECRSITDAASADDTGAATVVWHRATKAVARMDAVVDLIAGFGAGEEPNPTRITKPRQRLGLRTVLGISAEPIDSESLFRALQAHGIDKPVPAGPWSLYGAQIDSGASLSLPADQEDLRHRKNAYNEREARLEVNGNVPTLKTNGYGHIGYAA